MNTTGTEDQAQIAIFSWANWQQSKYPALKAMYHAANEGKRSRIAGANLKRQGMKPGVSDICLPYAAGGYNNLYIELKVGNNKPTEAQIEFIDTINMIGGKALVVYEAENAIEVIKAYLEGKIDKLETRSDTYPADKAKLTERVRYKGVCGKDCRKCKDMSCLGRKDGR